MMNCLTYVSLYQRIYRIVRLVGARLHVSYSLIVMSNRGTTVQEPWYRAGRRNKTLRVADASVPIYISHCLPIPPMKK